MTILSPGAPSVSVEGEDLRAVIWDLDETFWLGTLTEGGVSQYSEFNEKLVVELARRGIVSSICSKNDFETVKALLVARGVWDYFVFPSIDWTPKGPRVAALVADLQLRPETVLFLDDHPQNLAAAAATVPGLLTASPDFAAEMAAHPRFRGKDDAALSRLEQYRLLERRKREEQDAGGDPHAFLRGCGIKVRIEQDVVAQLDRAIELINRTNQLNFTKNRLPEDIEEARRILRHDLSQRSGFAGLVHVEDRYGDYGYVGFFLGDGYEEKKLQHFCFSCRMIGMEVETWVYRQLMRPKITVAGEVLADLFSDTPIDWINCAGSDEKAQTTLLTTPELRLRGGCDLDPLLYYIATPKRVRETNYYANFSFLRRDAVANLNTFLDPPDSALLADLQTMGVDPGFMDVKTFDPCVEGALVILSFWGDFRVWHYGHKASGKMIGLFVSIERPDEAFEALVENPDEDLSPYFGHLKPEETERRAAIERLIRGLAKHFKFFGALSPRDIGANLRRALSRAPAGCRVALLLPPVKMGRHEPADLNSYVQEVREVSKSAVAEFEFARAIDTDECILAPEETDAFYHFDRIVYFRISQLIQRELETADPAWPTRRAVSTVN